MTHLRLFLDLVRARLTRGHIVFAALFILLGMLSTLVPSGEKPGQAAPTGETQVVTVAQDTAQTSSEPGSTTSTTTPYAPGARPTELGGKWEVVTSDEFLGTSLADGEFGWHIYHKPDGKPRRTSQNVSVSDGFLHLVGTYGSTSHMGSGLSHAYDQMYGRWEVRARADKGAGYSPTILLWPKSEKWPQDGEIDMLETPRGDRSNPEAVIHNGIRNLNPSHLLEGNVSDWHTYAVDWLPDRITFYVDGKEQWKVTTKQNIPSTSPMHLAMQMDAGCGWIQCPNSSTPAVTDFQIDWIRVYKPVN